MTPSQDPSDRLLDSLLREQARQQADDGLLLEIEKKLDGAPPAARARRKPPRRLAFLTVAAIVMLTAATIFWLKEDKEPGLPAAVGLALIDEMQAVDAVPQKVVGGDWTNINTNASPAPSSTTTEAHPAPAELALRPDELKEAAQVPSATVRALPANSDKPAAADEVGEGWAYSGAAGGSGFGAIQQTGRSIRMRVVPPPDNYILLPESLTDIPARAADRDNYGRLIDQPWKSPWQDALSTFSIDVDTASYTNLRRTILDGRPIQADAVRIEECINYFDYRYEGPQGDGPFAVHSMLATCPWKPQHLLARVAIKGREVDAHARPASNIVFLIDVSGSMKGPERLPLLKRSMRVLIDQLDERDRVAMVVYAGSEGVVLEPTVLDERGRSQAIQALEKLEAGGSTNGGAGIKRAYEIAATHLVREGTNRVVLATDGDFNVGTTGQGDLVSLVKKGAAAGVSLSVLGFGTGNFNDAMLEAITNEGNGNYFYIDGDQEARRVFLQKLTGTLVTIAKDVKIQVEFNPSKVQAYRLIGYANRILRHQDFADDKVDAGDIGAGHTVTALYEIVPMGVAAPETGNVDELRYQRPAGKEAVPSDDWFTLKLRHKHPQGETSALIETSVIGEPVAWEQAENDFRFASAVAMFGMKLRQLPEISDIPWHHIEGIAKHAVAEDPQEQRTGFIELIQKLNR